VKDGGVKQYGFACSGRDCVELGDHFKQPSNQPNILHNIYIYIYYIATVYLNLSKI
jgi:hypothetical protein